MSKEIVPFQFNRDLPKGGGIGIYGASGKGKSSILYELFYQLRDKITAAFIVSGTEFQDPFFSKIIPHLCIHDNLNESTELSLKKFYTIHLTNVKNWKDKRKGKEPFAIIAFEDVTGSKLLREQNSIIVDLFVKCRHFNTLVILSYQKILTGLSLGIRENFQCVFAFSFDTKVSNGKILDYLMTIEGINKDQFHDIIHNKIRKKTEHTCLVKLRQNKKIETHSGIIETDLFYLSTKKIIDIPRFRLLEEKIWILDTKHYDKDYYENKVKKDSKKLGLDNIWNNDRNIITFK